MEQKTIRNFAIIAHVDHGKSTLADRMLEITKTIHKDKLQEQFLDQNPISRERGITIKLAPVRMMYEVNGIFYTLNLIDTPGHIDFSYEVSRTLAACEGVILLVDATQGIQAQTVAHFRSAKKLGLRIIPVLNKIDLPSALTDSVVKELETIGFKKEEMLFISAKTGENVELVLRAVIERIPSPKGQETAPLRTLIFDAVYDEYRGVVAYVRVIDGEIPKGMSVQFFQNNVKTDITEVGIFTPYLKESQKLTTGEIGYIITGIKDIRKVRVGDTVIGSKFKAQNSKLAVASDGESVEALSGYQIPKPMIFLGVYPKSTNDLNSLKESLVKLTLNDTSLTYVDEYSAYLGSGYRIGFLGLLHAEIVKQRLEQEFGLDLLFTMPHVLYEKTVDGQTLEPYMKLTVYTPSEYVGGVMTTCQSKKGQLIDMQYHEGYAVLIYEMPYSTFIRGLSSELKSISSGFASIDYELIEYRQADLAELEIRINDVPIDVLSEFVYKDEAIARARAKCEKLKDTLPRQQFRQIIQGLMNNTIVAREEVPPFRKDVLQKMSGGDVTRKNKLLDRQKKGKSKMLQSGKVILPQEALFSMIEN
jgi:GTP-binding protein LepA